MSWSIETFHESFRYGTLITPFLIKDGWYHCYRVRRDKKNVWIDKSEKMVLTLPLFGKAETKATIGDLIFVHADRSNSLLRIEEGIPFFLKKPKEKP